jgi:hypothetical protein
MQKTILSRSDAGESFGKPLPTTGRVVQGVATGKLRVSRTGPSSLRRVNTKELQTFMEQGIMKPEPEKTNQQSRRKTPGRHVVFPA